MDSLHPKRSDGSESHPYPVRRRLPHDPPSFIDASQEIFFITIACKSRVKNQLCHTEVAEVLFNATRFYQDAHRWFVHLLLLMPDHVHFLVRFSVDSKMKLTVESWKRYTSRQAGLRWQRDFFDHRLRSNESFSAKFDYIIQNPMRAGLVSDAEDWPYVFISEW